MTCTWLGCTEQATVPQVAKDGAQWANLCAAHDAEITESIETTDIKAMLSNWVKAQGGSKKAAARLV